MKSNLLITIIAVLTITTASPAQQKATLIIHNANVITLDDVKATAQAIAIVNDKIIAVGSNNEILKTKTRRSIVIDAKGRTVIPGLFDSHLHVIRGGRFYNTELRWEGVKTLDRALQMLKE